MLVLITYDVNTETSSGRKRLRAVSKQCLNYGQRVQNSVFECQLTSAELRIVEDKLVKIIDDKKDSLRFYMIGNTYKNKIKRYGLERSFDVSDPLIV